MAIDPSVSIDLNADVGESFGIYVIGDDDALFGTITSANVAAGFHAGDPSVMRRTVRAAIAHGVSVGAHPGFPDLPGFGRREMHLTQWEVEDAVLYQIASVAGMAKVEGAEMRHVKPHGALYNMAARDNTLAAAIVRAVVSFDRRLLLFAPPASALAEAGATAGLRVVPEGFADRRYDSRGVLISRSRADACIDNDGLAARQAVQLATQGAVACADGSVLAMPVQTLCIHGDAPGAARRAAVVRRALEEAGVTVRSPAPA